MIKIEKNYDIFADNPGFVSITVDPTHITPLLAPVDKSNFPTKKAELLTNKTAQLKNLFDELTRLESDPSSDLTRIEALQESLENGLTTLEREIKESQSDSNHEISIFSTQIPGLLKEAEA